MSLPKWKILLFPPAKKDIYGCDLINDTFLDLVEDFWQGKGKFEVRGLIEDEIWLKGIGSSD
jgi:hypothetical protein